MLNPHANLYTGIVTEVEIENCRVDLISIVFVKTNFYLTDLYTI